MEKLIISMVIVVMFLFIIIVSVGVMNYFKIRDIEETFLENNNRIWKFFCTDLRNYIHHEFKKIEKGERKMNLNKVAEEIHENAVAHGWWEEERELPEIIALCHSELSEALEEYRNHSDMIYKNGDKPEGIAVEMVDCMIRILDYLRHEGVDVESVLKIKMDYNKTRPYRHGNKTC